MGDGAFFGDSFVRLFGLARHTDVSVPAFKGATCRGRGTEGNENRVELTRRLAATPGTKVAIYNFGNVAVHLSNYYSPNGRAAPQSSGREVSTAASSSSASSSSSSEHREVMARLSHVDTKVAGLDGKMEALSKQVAKLCDLVGSSIDRKLTA